MNYYYENLETPVQRANYKLLVLKSLIFLDPFIENLFNHCPIIFMVVDDMSWKIKIIAG